MRPDGGAGPYPYPAPCGWCRVWPGDWHRPATLELNPACPTHAPRPAAPAGQSGTNQALVYLLIVFGILAAFYVLLHASRYSGCVITPGIFSWPKACF